MGKYDKIPICLPYHPSSELLRQKGYYPNISIAQLKAASELIYLIEKEGLNFNTDQENEFLKILRFLRARKFNVKAALAMIRDDIEWRSEENRLCLPNETAYDVLSCDVGKLYQYFPTWIQGKDKQLRPVSYRQFGKFEIWNVLKLTTLNRLIRFHAWETEAALRSMYALSNQTGYNIETFVLVVDASGWNMHLATSDAFAFIKGMAVTDSDHYPERLGAMFIINAPSMLYFAWRIVQGFLDSATKEKIKILSSDMNEWKHVLLQYIDEDEIPMQYGGKARDFTAEEAISAMNPANSILYTDIAEFKDNYVNYSLNDTNKLFNNSNSSDNKSLHSCDEKQKKLPEQQRVYYQDKSIQTDNDYSYFKRLDRTKRDDDNCSHNYYSNTEEKSSSSKSNRNSSNYSISVADCGECNHQQQRGNRCSIM